MEQKILIVGAGGFGREVAGWLKDELSHCGSGERLGGFIDDRREALDNYEIHPKVVADVSSACTDPAFASCRYVLAIGNPGTRAAIADRLLAAGRVLRSVIHPTAVLGRAVTLGNGSILCPHTTLTCDVRLGQGVIVNAHSSLGHDVCVGDWTTLSGHCEITGECTVGSRVFFGCGARVIPQRRLGDDCLVGAGAVVMSHLRPGSRVYGNPARPL